MAWSARYGALGDWACTTVISISLRTLSKPRVISTYSNVTSSRASKDYLQILQYAARLSESAVNTVLGQLLRSGELPTLGAVEVLLQLSETPPLEDVHIDEVELTAYDHLLDGEEEVVQC